MAEDEQGWTLVLHRKPLRRHSSLHSAALPPSRLHRKPRRTISCPDATRLSFPTSPQEIQDEEKRILARLNRSIQTMEQSQFYHRFLEQLLSPLVMDNIRRVVTMSVQKNRQSKKFSGGFTGVKDEDGRIWQTNKLSDGFTGGKDEDGRIWQTNKLSGGFIDLHVFEKLNETIAMAKRKNKDGRIWQVDVVAYGIGSISDSEISRCQFSLLLLLRKTFSWIGKIDIYDPVLSQAELNVIGTLGCRPTAVNENGKRIVDRPTVFYMPHCEEWLYDNVLSANWSILNLCNVIIFGNSFQAYQERWSLPIVVKSKSPPKFLLRIQKYAREIPLAATSSLDLPVFNDISWHFFVLDSFSEPDIF